MARAPKVFAARLGFFDTVVAVPSQKAALEAWGVHRNLFADGEAAESQDADAMKAATAQPGVVLRRPVGSKDPYTAEATVKAPPPSNGKAGKPARKPPDRSKLDAAEAALAALEAERDEARAEIEKRRAALEAEAETAERDFAKRERPLAKAVETARTAFVKAGGKA